MKYITLRIVFPVGDSYEDNIFNVYGTRCLACFLLSESVNAPSYTILHPRMDHYIIGDHRSAFGQLTEDEESPKSCQGHKNVLKTLQEHKK